MSHVSEVITRDLYDTSVSDRVFKARLTEAARLDVAPVAAPGARRLSEALARLATVPGYSVKV